MNTSMSGAMTEYTSPMTANVVYQGIFDPIRVLQVKLNLLKTLSGLLALPEDVEVEQADCLQDRAGS